MRADLRDVLNNSAPTRVKTVLQTPIDGIQVHARDNIQPTFRVPAVRVDYGYMGPTWIEPVTSCLQSIRGHAGTSVFGALQSRQMAVLLAKLAHAVLEAVLDSRWYSMVRS